MTIPKISDYEVIRSLKAHFKDMMALKDYVRDQQKIVSEKYEDQFYAKLILRQIEIMLKDIKYPEEIEHDHT